MARLRRFAPADRTHLSAVLARSWLVLLWTALMVLLPVATLREGSSRGAPWPDTVSPALAPPGPAHGDEGARLEAADEGTVIAADYAPLASDLRAPERVELLSALSRVLSAGPGSLPARAHRGGAAFAPPARAAATWCDLVQCRRQGGEQLLRFATAPPTRV